MKRKRRQEQEHAAIRIQTHMRMHRSHNLVNEIISIAKKHKIETALNTPFAGTLVPLKHYGKVPRVNSVMLEIRRDQYMDESNMVLDSERMNLLKSMLTEIISNT